MTHSDSHEPRSDQVAVTVTIGTQVHQLTAKLGGDEPYRRAERLCWEMADHFDRVQRAAGLPVEETVADHAAKLAADAAPRQRCGVRAASLPDNLSWPLPQSQLGRTCIRWAGHTGSHTDGASRW